MSKCYAGCQGECRCHPVDVLTSMTEDVAVQTGRKVDYDALRKAREHCDQLVEVRPEAPIGEGVVWYRGWECTWSFNAEYWTGVGYQAAKGGFDLDCQTVESSSWQGLLDEVDAQEDA